MRWCPGALLNKANQTLNSVKGGGSYKVKTNPYMVWAGDAKEDGACLVFAQTAREAKQKGWPYVEGWHCETEYTETRARLLRTHRDYLMSLQNAADKDGVVESPPTCERCEVWGAQVFPDGSGCEFCGSSVTAATHSA